MILLEEGGTGRAGDNSRVLGAGFARRRRKRVEGMSQMKYKISIFPKTAWQEEKFAFVAESREHAMCACMYANSIAAKQILQTGALNA